MTEQSPYRPTVRRAHCYASLQQEPTGKNDLFTIVLTAKYEGGQLMEEQKFLIDLIFKPNNQGLKLRPAETQLLLSYISEILKEVEAEENTTKSEGIQP